MKCRRSVNTVLIGKYVSIRGYAQIESNLQLNYNKLAMQLIPLADRRRLMRI